MRDTLHTEIQRGSNVVEFRPRTVTTSADTQAREVSVDHIHALLDLSRYELRKFSGGADEFGRRMRINIAALIFVVALAGLAAADVLKLERAQWPPAETIIARSDLS